MLEISLWTQSCRKNHLPIIMANALLKGLYLFHVYHFCIYPLRFFFGGGSVFVCLFVWFWLFWEGVMVLRNGIRIAAWSSRYSIYVNAVAYNKRYCPQVWPHGVGCSHQNQEWNRPHIDVSSLLSWGNLWLMCYEHTGCKHTCLSRVSSVYCAISGDWWIAWEQ